MKSFFSSFCILFIVAHKYSQADENGVQEDFGIDEPYTAGDEYFIMMGKVHEEIQSLKREHAELRAAGNNEEGEIVEEKIRHLNAELHQLHRKDSHRVRGRQFIGEDRGGNSIHDEIHFHQQHYNELIKDGKHEEAASVRETIRDKMASAHAEDINSGKVRHKFDGTREDDMLVREHMRKHRDRHMGKVSGKIGELNRHRADEMLRQIDTVGFTADEIVIMKKKVEEYHQLEVEFNTARAEKWSKIDAHASDADVQVTSEREDEIKKLLKHKRRDIESRIRERKHGHDHFNGEL